jgi:uncharacterized protein YcnI
MLGSRLAVVRTAMVAFAAAAAGAVAFAAPASADVTVTPTQAFQDDTARLTFQVTTDPGAAPTTKVQVAMPESAPIAEVYPMSNPDWAPALTQRKLDRPLQGIHGSQITEVVTMITWTTRQGWSLPAGKPAVLDAELGPLPEADQVVFTVTQTHADGAVDPPRQLTLKLAPLPAGQAQGQGHDPHGGAAEQTGDQAAQAPSGDGSDSGGTRLAVIISVLVIGLVGGAALGAFVLPRLRRGAAGFTVSPDTLNAPTAEEAPATEKAAADANAPR